MKGLEAMKLVAKHPDGGRMITSAGRRDADRIASQVMAAHVAAASVIDVDPVVVVEPEQPVGVADEE